MGARFGRVLAFALTLAAAPSGAALAHGGVAMDQDVCRLTIGTYWMHFTGYQPEKTRAEFCEDIPQTGKTVIVLDFADDAMRDIPLGFKIVRQTDGPIERAPVLLERQPQLYPTGSVAIRTDFAEPGNYVGIVTLGERLSSVSQFPFSVGQNRMWHHLAIGGVLVIAAAVGLFFYGTRRQRSVSAAVAAALVMLPDLAQAHTALIATEPPADVEIADVPTSIVLRFSSKIEPKFAQVTVEHDGKSVPAGQASVDANATTVSIPVSLPRGGSFHVHWTVLAVDGHRSAGDYTFTIRQ